MLFMKEQPASPVHVLPGSPEKINWEYDPGHQRLEFPSSPVITQSPDRPAQQWRRHHVKQAQQANGERQARVKHVFRTAHNMASGQQSANEIDCVEGLEQEHSRRRPRKNQRTLQPQANSDQYISNVAEK